MSDCIYIMVAGRFIPVEIVDEDWLGESLSDDEVELPKDYLTNAMEDLEDDDDDDGFIPTSEIDSFNDLGLDNFVANLETEAVNASSSAYTQALISAQRELNEARDRARAAANNTSANDSINDNHDQN